MKKCHLLLLFIALLSSCTRMPDGVIESRQEDAFQSDLIPPKRIVEIENDHVFIDFGKDAFGTLILESKFGQTDTLVVHLGEKLTDSTRIDRHPGGTIRYQQVKIPELPADSIYRIDLPPDKRNTGERAVALPDSFKVIMPFRYCELENLQIPLGDMQICQKIYHYRFDPDASLFSSSDSVLNQVWDLCKYSIKATSFAGLYIDGDRERIPYEADAYINQLSHYSVDDEYEIARKTNRYFIDHPTWPTEWILHTVLLFYQDYMYTGQTRDLAEYFDRLKIKTLSDLDRGDGLISSKTEQLNGQLMLKLGFSDSTQKIRDIVDWPPAQNDTRWDLATQAGERDGYDMDVQVNTVVNCFYYQNLKLMSEIAAALDKHRESEEWADRAKQTRESINSKLLDPETGIYRDGESSGHSSLHANMFPLAFGLVPLEHQETVIEFVKSRGMACSVYGAQFLLEGLYRYGEADYALRLMTSKSDRSWWNMIRTGSTITMEAWDMKYKPNADWNHAWGAAPANIISRCLWGIRPLEPGFKKVQIHPQPGSLISSQIKVPTRRGPIQADYHRLGERQLYTVYIPRGMIAEFYTAERSQRIIRVNHKTFRTGRKCTLLKSGENHLEIRSK